MISRLSFYSLTTIFLLCSSTLALATENGQIMYPSGVNTVLTGMLPPAGKTQIFNYMKYYTAKDLNDSDGNDIDKNYNLDVFAEVVRVLHTWEQEAGPFSLSSGIVLPLVYIDMELFGQSDDTFNLGDMTLQPLNIGYSNSSNTFHSYLAFDVGIPTGSYSQDDMVNTGVNYFSLQPVLNMTWLPAPDWDISGAFALQINSENDDTDYQSGTLSMLDYSIGYMVTDKLQLAVQGYLARQLSDDQVAGATYNDGNKLQVNAIGPQLRYDFMPGSAFVFKWQHESDVENRSEGDTFWLKATFIL